MMSDLSYTVEIGGIRLEIAGDPALFSPRAADRGTLAMVSSVRLETGQKLLDLGCGCGIVGIWAALSGADALLADIDPRAVECARANARRNGAQCRFAVSDGFRQIDETGFDWILSNPPYHSDYAVARHFIEKGFNRLRPGGRLVLVVKRPDWYRNKLRTIFGGFRDEAIDGYHVLTAERRSLSYHRKGGAQTTL